MTTSYGEFKPDPWSFAVKTGWNYMRDLSDDNELTEANRRKEPLKPHGDDLRREI